MICKVCSKGIEIERLSILPNTVFCAPCAQKYSTVKPYKGVNIYSHKTGGELQVMTHDHYENTKHYYVPNGNGRSAMKNFSKNTCA
jgi:RNA polymerase-binding transcription factor DksA